jgi:hypothetical protein
LSSATTGRGVERVQRHLDLPADPLDRVARVHDGHRDVRPFDGRESGPERLDEGV